MQDIKVGTLQKKYKTCICGLCRLFSDVVTFITHMNIKESAYIYIFLLTKS